MSIKSLKSLFIIIFVIFILFLISWFYFNILLFAKVSFIGACEPEIYDVEFNESYTTGGYFEVTFNESTQELDKKIVILSEPKLSTLKHEECHLRQYEQRRLGNCCDKRLLLFLNEVECYSIQRFYELFE